MPKSVRASSATSLPEKLIKIGAKVVGHGRRYVPGNFVAYRPVAGAARASVTGRWGQIWYSDLTDHNGRGAP